MKKLRIKNTDLDKYYSFYLKALQAIALEDWTGGLIVDADSTQWQEINNQVLSSYQAKRTTTYEYGPGTELESMLLEAGISKHSACACEERKRRMNHLGPMGCLKNLQGLVAELKQAFPELNTEEKIRAVGYFVSEWLFTVKGILECCVARAQAKECGVEGCRNLNPCELHSIPEKRDMLSGV
jgi:hypothetical protein